MMINDDNSTDGKQRKNRRSSSGVCIPAGLLGADVFLEHYSRSLHPQELLADQPAAQGLLDADACLAQLLRPQVLQVGHLARTEEDLGFAELILVSILRTKIKEIDKTGYHVVL